MTPTIVSATGPNRRIRCGAGIFGTLLASAGTVTAMPAAHADNRRLNNGVVSDVYTIQHQTGCTTNLQVNPESDARVPKRDGKYRSETARIVRCLGLETHGREGVGPHGPAVDKPRRW
jgi:hypothetical protein